MIKATDFSSGNKVIKILAKSIIINIRLCLKQEKKLWLTIKCEKSMKDQKMREREWELKTENKGMPLARTWKQFICPKKEEKKKRKWWKNKSVSCLWWKLKARESLGQWWLTETLTRYNPACSHHNPGWAKKQHEDVGLHERAVTVDA